MEVLRHGNTYKEIECPKCGALLSYCDRDIHYFNSSIEYDGEIHFLEKLYVICPECKDFVNIQWLLDGIETDINCVHGNVL